MALEYRMTLAGHTPVGQVAVRAFPHANDDVAVGGPSFSANYKEACGFNVTITAGADGYLSLLTDEGSWEWEPDSYVRIQFRLDKVAEPGWAVTNMLTAVRRVLETGREDMTLDFNGDILLLVRRGGEVTKHRRGTWWQTYAPDDGVLPG